MSNKTGCYANPIGMDQATVKKLISSAVKAQVLNAKRQTIKVCQKPPFV